MNLAEIRAAMFAQADWSPNQSTEAVGRVNGFINRAYGQLAQEAPFLFFEDKLKTTTEPDVTSASDLDTVILLGPNTLASAEEDPWTFVTSYTKTVADATPASYTTTWKTDRSWDGREIEITATDGTVIRNQIRTIWHDASDDKWKFTVVYPWNWSERGTGENTPGFKFRIFTGAYPFPDDIITMRSMRLFDDARQYPLTVLGQDEAESLTLVGPRSQLSAAPPRSAFRREHFQLEGPGMAPRVSMTPAGAQSAPYPWKGPERPGEFEYVVTYTWGKRDAEFRLPGLPKWDTYATQWLNSGQTITSNPTEQVADNRIREPRYESAPSPVSARITPLVGDTEFRGIKLVVPNIEYALGFLTQHPSGHGSPTGARVSQHQSGIHVRIYRKRLSEMENVLYSGFAASAEGLTSPSFMDNKQKFYLLAEMRIDQANKGVFIDDGQYIPDRSRPLRDIHGYQQYALSPIPDKRYELDVRCVRRPQKLEDERDVPRIHAEAINVLVDRAMAYLYESMGNLDASQLMRARYQDALITLSKRYGDLRPAAIPVLRRMVRARYSSRSRDNYRKWYKTGN